jgi:WD40 repeat protein
VGLMMGKMPFYLWFFFRIIKIWDKDTLSLQASLHGHEDFIVDMSVSFCNKYLASASKDGQIIIWDLERCKMIDKFVAH